MQDDNALQSRLKALERENANLQKQLEQIEKERDEYLQNVSHQIVAPLNAMKWHIENLTEARVGVERAKKVLRSIYSQATLAVHLAKNFQLMSNLAADHAPSSIMEPLQRVSLCRLLINLSDDFQPLGWENGLQIGVEAKELELAPEVLAFKPLISQVFSNILENAVKYSNKETRIIIKGEHLKDKGNVLVKISNQGLVLDANDILHVFDRGYRSKSAQDKYPAGTGFGLYIAKRIVELHKGEIGVACKNGLIEFSVVLSVEGLKGRAPIRD